MLLHPRQSLLSYRALMGALHCTKATAVWHWQAE